LIAKRLSQPIDKTVADKEEHHIIPKSFGGTETVYLTVREHIFAHELLVLIYKDSDYCKFRKMLSALNVIYNKNSQQLRKVKTHSKPLASIIVKYRI